MERKWYGEVVIRTMEDDESKVRLTDDMKGSVWGIKKEIRADKGGRRWLERETVAQERREKRKVTGVTMMDERRDRC